MAALPAVLEPTKVIKKLLVMMALPAVLLSWNCRVLPLPSEALAAVLLFAKTIRPWLLLAAVPAELEFWKVVVELAAVVR